jgi:hypothetical protein
MDGDSTDFDLNWKLIALFGVAVASFFFLIMLLMCCHDFVCYGVCGWNEDTSYSCCRPNRDNNNCRRDYEGLHNTDDQDEEEAARNNTIPKIVITMH